jgi:predicted phosphate transport protein (TIGR00153 family)
MKLDQLIKKLLPHDDHFYVLLEESAQNLVKAGVELKKLPLCKKQSQREETAKRIKDIEHDGDSITHNIFSELNSTFVTPLDREDIHELASALDDVLDHMDGCAHRFVMYKITRVPKAIPQLIDVLILSIQELKNGVHLLRNLNKTDLLEDTFKKVNEYENQADEIFDQAVADLFAKERNAIQIIKLKEILVGLETATDKCEDAANVLEGILIKHN